MIFNHNFRQKIGYTSLENSSSNYRNERPRSAEPLCEVSTIYYICIKYIAMNMKNCFANSFTKDNTNQLF